MMQSLARITALWLGRAAVSSSRVARFPEVRRDGCFNKLQGLVCQHCSCSANHLPHWFCCVYSNQLNIRVRVDEDPKNLIRECRAYRTNFFKIQDNGSETIDSR